VTGHFLQYAVNNIAARLTKKKIK